ncbi:beta-lactamase family protein [Aetokthonos hydrillicola Thurmond2011]|jgi:CubicO group peptidase (beta-lactamase class C family)|uniref:Beta-lactamase family protein n=1 Tax=Aetokthonos hydrillicola Thurmond2011 TaxID=2712845 RepID=A0AAP5I950_9CYAN|nr:serine hydrolase domain-containing protein [Aetokthonos hydrillicola]MBO3463345.1 beta-lactamase family protein [Aetokthonos hydrillicola CCALA 1050]MBW4589556.1 beta-lactamase family protein [Aetokthonos hydrillicola CCALA 1050]MDR9896019.1 beta-lactamase family protein [Aetokthonos hydrillicola Thurmond2011]
MPKILSRRQLLYGVTALTSLLCASLIDSHSKYSLSATDKVITNLEAQVPVLMQAALIPGLQLAIIRNRELFWSHGFGVTNKYTKKSVTNDTIFAAASLSKPLLAYAALKMVEQGKLDLDAPLTDYTAKPYISDPRIKLITTRRVLSHTTGFPNWSGDDPLKIEFSPGTRFSYSGEGYIYLQKVVEEITQQPLNEYLHSSIFVPSGMDSSSLIWESGYQATASDGHDRQGKPTPMSKPKRASAAGSLRTTASDYAKFLMMMMQPGTIDSPRLTEASLHEMLRSQIQINQLLGWGLGWGLEKTRDGNFFWHWGDLETFKSFTIASKESGIGIVILTNSQNGLKICNRIVSLAISGKHPAFNFKMINY